jgi:hypothetical protein
VKRQLSERLESDRATYDSSDLPEVLLRFEDRGQIVRVHKQPWSVYPQFIVLNGAHPNDGTDALAPAWQPPSSIVVIVSWCL